MFINQKIAAEDMNIFFAYSNRTVLCHFIILYTCSSPNYCGILVHSDTHYIRHHSHLLPPHMAYILPHTHINSHTYTLMSCTHKSTGVVITNGAGIAEGLQHRIGKQQKILHFLDILKTAGDVGNVAHDDLGSLRLASPALTCVYKQHRAGNQALDHHHPQTLLLAPYSISDTW